MEKEIFPQFPQQEAGLPPTLPLDGLWAGKMALETGPPLETSPSQVIHVGSNVLIMKMSPYFSPLFLALVPLSSLYR